MISFSHSPERAPSQPPRSPASDTRKSETAARNRPSAACAHAPRLPTQPRYAWTRTNALPIPVRRNQTRPRTLATDGYRTSAARTVFFYKHVAPHGECPCLADRRHALRRRAVLETTARGAGLFAKQIRETPRRGRRDAA